MKRAVMAMTVLFSANLYAAAPEKISIKAPDGTQLQALFAMPTAGKPTIVMHHGLSSVKEEWFPLIDSLMKKGYGVLAYDARPAGTPWTKLVDDMGAVVLYLEKQKSIDRKTICLAGASLGANVALKYSALTGVGKGVLLLSPGLNYQGLTTETSMSTLKKTPVLIIANPADPYAYQSSIKLIQLSSKGDFWSSEKPGHGVQMFDENLLKRLVVWFDQL